MRAEYGSNLHQFIDKNIDDDFAVEIITEVNQALKVLASVFKLVSVKINNNNEKVSLDISGEWLETGEVISLPGVKIT